MKARPAPIDFSDAAFAVRAEMADDVHQKFLVNLRRELAYRTQIKEAA